MDTAQAAEAASPPAASPPNREHEIDEVMDFLRFSVKRDTNFDGTILFKFKNNEGENASTYLVSISKTREVTTMKNGSAKDVKDLTCEVTISVDDFLWIYSGKATSSDLLKLVYAGRVAISGYAFRKASAFAQSFDFSSDKWRNFYAWRDREDQVRRSPGALDEVNNVGSPARDFWFYYCRAILERHNISKLQRITWEASLASMFGDQFVLDNLLRSVNSRRSFSLPQSQRREFQGLIAGLVGVDAPPSRVEHELSHFFNPTAKRRNSIASVLSLKKKDESTSGVFDFFDEEYVDAVKLSAKQRHLRARSKNRVDLADAGMDQLDKLLKALGKDGHSNQQRKTKAKYVPAPELFLHEFRSQTTEVVHLIKEKALGRKSADRIPPPDTAWLFGGDSSVMVVNDPSDGSRKHSPSKSRLSTQALVVVNRSPIQRRGSKREFALPKQKLKAKFASISRDLARRNTALSVEDHLIFSDYV
ncbi:hypothetical protein Poli38472_002462 [Pythium oligandrum]|uniref:Uncharacterized protein n=1 Tax=Pythium oligandrum TaxID=41045 RepID=A0A8K1CIS2_PYTOL|nr:hypothetical protein Poli38472_002462 [Pythium oligandrum]|eukprot:TMW63521.1 hypothetical protein Poli38472_002462 [Pythium oligandrum]